METKTFTVPNISCEHCVHTIQNEVGELPGVRQVKADQKTKQVIVEWETPATWTAIEKTLVEMDYAPAN
jgi:copper chaperone